MDDLVRQLGDGYFIVTQQGRIVAKAHGGREASVQYDQHAYGTDGAAAPSLWMCVPTLRRIPMYRED